nr:ribosomal protein L19 [Ochrosphaera neapolitana]
MTTLEKLVSENEFFYKKSDIPLLSIGDTVKVTIYLELPKELDSETVKKGKERIQSYEGVVISKHGNQSKTTSTITVRKMFQGGGIEKVFLLNSPWIKEIQILTSAKVRRSKLYYLRQRTGKAARLKRIF